MKAPSFESIAHCGTPVKSDEILRKKNLLIYFFPEINFTDINQVGQEAYTFKNYLVRLNLAQNEVVGVTDHPDELKTTFVQRFGIPFHILADRDRAIAKNYGAVAADGKTERTLVCIRKGGALARTAKAGDIERTLREMVRFTRLPWYRKLFRKLF